MDNEILIPAIAGTLQPYTPPALKGRDPKPVFWLRTPTAEERDGLATRTFYLGLRPVTQQIIRATLIDELYRIHGDDKGDQMANEFESFWQSAQADQRAAAEWEEQEVQRQLDISEGAPPRAPAAQPIPITHRRLNAKITLMTEELMNSSARLMKLQERQMDYNNEQGRILARLGVAKVENLELPDGVPAIAPDVDTPASADWVRKLRSVLPDNAWDQLTDHIDKTYRLDETERKNSDSPPSKPSDQTPSPEQSGASESNAGSSTDSNTGPVQTDESATTIAAS